MKLPSTLIAENYAVTGRRFLNGVFGWMALGLALTALIAYLVYSTPLVIASLVTDTGMTGLGYVVVFAPIGFVLLMSFGFNRLSRAALLVLYVLYAGIMGVSLSFLFLVYTSQSIYGTFIIAALMFGVMGLIGYATKTDLTKMGSILLMALVGIIIASLVNLFMKSDSLSYVISFISVLVFCGLTAWDMQKLKILAQDTAVDAERTSKLGILGALTLYLDFINLFLSLLRFTGKRRSD